MKYKNYELVNLKCMMLDMPKISKLFKKYVDLTIGHPMEDELGTTYITECLHLDGKKLGLDVLEFEVICHAV